MKKICFGILTVLAAASAFGQTYRAEGRGDLTRGRDKQEVRDVKVVFTRSTFILTLGLDRSRRTIVVEGNYTRIDDRRSVKILSIDGAATEGTGNIIVEGDLVKTVDIFGDPESGRYSLKFRARNEDDRTDGRVPPSGRIEATGNTSGPGRHRLGRDEDDIKKVTFTLRENGYLILTFDFRKGRDVTYIGRWTGKGDTRRFTLDGGRGSRITGDGTLHLSDDRKEIRKLEFDGRVGDDRLSIDFKDK